MNDTPNMSCANCKCPCHIMKPLCITLIGLAFLLQALGILSAMLVSYIWPILLMVIGISKMCGKMCKCCVKK